MSYICQYSYKVLSYSNLKEQFNFDNRATFVDFSMICSKILKK